MNKLRVCAFGKTGTKLLSELVRQKSFLARNLELIFFINEKSDGTCDFVPPDQNHQAVRLSQSEDFAGKIHEKLAGSTCLLLIAGLGGANGGRQLLAAVNEAIKKGMTLSCFAIMPFSYQGAHRHDFAQQELCRLKKLSIPLTLFSCDDSLINMNDETSYSESMLNAARLKLLEVLRAQIYVE